jgi:predicted RNA-binding protein with PIN domain
LSYEPTEYNKQQATADAYVERLWIRIKEARKTNRIFKRLENT